MPQGFDNRGINAYYGEAKSKNLYGKDAYVIKNNGNSLRSPRASSSSATTPLTNPIRGRS
jgi:hypothetical protein